jgi:hypothetical protein
MTLALRACQILTILTACSCWGQVQFPTYPYILPAVAEKGGPIYVIPGTVTDDSTIPLTNVTGSVCLRAGYCTNAAGIVTAAAGNTTAPGFDSFFVELQPDGTQQVFEYGAVLISIEGVGNRQVFPAIQANGLNSISPPTSFNASQPTFKSLGFKKFSAQNAQIRFIVADTDYGDNSGDYLLTLQTPSLTYNAAAPTKKVEQVVGPCDWETWVPPGTTSASGTPIPPVCDETAASGFPSQVLGMDLGFSFEDPIAGNLIFLFGDTIGVQVTSGSALVPAVQSPSQFPDFGGHDAIATSANTSTALSFPLDFLEKPGTSPGPGIPNAPVFVEPLYEPSKVPVPMGGNDVPNSGIHVDGVNYIIVNTGASSTAATTQEFAQSVLVKYVSNTNFIAGRTISTANVLVSGEAVPDGHFVFVAPHKLPLDFAQQLGLPEQVMIFGNAQYRAESIYLSMIPADQFWDKDGTATTLYFAGLDDNGQPTWTTTELCAVPVVYDNPLGTTPVSTGNSCTTTTGQTYSTMSDPGRAGNVSVSYNKNLSLWLMTWDGGRQTGALGGIYFSYASAPWGPWSQPENIYNPCFAHVYYQGFGDFIHYSHNAKDDLCADLGVTVTNDSGPAGPIIGADGSPFLGANENTGETAMSRNGTVYAPFQIERFATVQDGLLSIYFNMATWNPYTVVLMQSNFTIAP